MCVCFYVAFDLDEQVDTTYTKQWVLCKCYTSLFLIITHKSLIYHSINIIDFLDAYNDNGKLPSPPAKRILSLYILHEPWQQKSSYIVSIFSILGNMQILNKLTR